MAAYDHDITLTTGLDIDDVLEKSEELSADIQGIFSKQTGKESPAFKSLLTQMDKTVTKADQIKARMAELSGQTFETEQYSANNARLDQIADKELPKAIENANKLDQKLKKLGAVKIPTSEYSALQKELSAAEKKAATLDYNIQKFIDLDGNTDSKTFRRMQYDADQLKAKMDDLHSEMRSLEEAGQHVTLGKDTQKFKDTYAKYQEQMKVIQQLDAEYRKLVSTQSQLEEAGQDVIFGEETEEYRQLGEQLNEVNNSMVRLRTSASSMGSSMGSVVRPTRTLTVTYIDLAKAIIRVLKPLATVVTNFGKLAGSTIINGIKRLGSSITNLNKSGNNNNDVFKKALRTLLKYGLGVRSFYFLFRKLRSALFGGFEDLAKAHEPFNAAMSNMKTALADLKNSFAAAFAPIIQVVEPILTRFIYLISEAVTKLGMLISALTGKPYAKVATTYQDYAASADKASKSTSKAAEAVKDTNEEAKRLKRTLAGFDDIEILQRDDDDTKTSTTTPTANTTPTLADVPVSDAIKDFAKNLLDAWNNADFTDLGRILGEKLKNALDNIPWDKIKSVLSNIAKSIATFLNGFLETPGLFTSIGRTIAEGINSAFTFVESFVRNFHWASLGTAIKDLIIGMLDNIDWKLIYKTMGELGTGLGQALNAALNNREIWEKGATAVINGFKAILIGLNNFLKEVKWSELGTNISTGVTNALKQINWKRDVFPVLSRLGTSLAQFLNGLFKPDTFSVIGSTIANLLNSALHFLDNFGSTFDWANFGNSIAAGVNEFFNTFDFLKLVSALESWALGLLISLQNALVGIHWYELGQKVKEGIENIHWKLLMYNIGKLVINGINASLDLFAGLFDGTPVSDKLKELKTTINDIAENIDLESLEKGFKDLGKALAPFVEGFASGLVEVFEGLLKVGQGFLNALGPIMSKIADAVNKFDPELIENAGHALGILFGAVIAFNTAKLVATTIANIGLSILGLNSAATTAAATGGGVALFTGALGSLSAVLGGVAAGLWLTEEAVSSTEEELGPATAAEHGLYEAVSKVGKAYGLTDEQIGELAWSLFQSNTSVQGAKNAMEGLDAKLNAAGVSTDAFKTELFNLAGQDARCSTAMNNIAKATDGVDGSNKAARASTDKLSEMLGDFSKQCEVGKSKTSLLKVGIEQLGKQGDLSKGQVDKLQKTLDKMDPKNPKQTLDTISREFQESGIDADKFVNAVVKGYGSLDRRTQVALKPFLDNQKKFPEERKAEGTKAGKNLVDGVTSGITQNQSKLAGEVKNTAQKHVVGAWNSEMGVDSGGKSSKAAYLGRSTVDGVTAGVNEKKDSLHQTMGTVVTSGLRKMEDGVEGRGGVASARDIGHKLDNDLDSGISQNKHYVEGTMGALSSDISGKITGTDLRNPGAQLCIDLFNGLRDNQHYPVNVAETIGTNIYNSFNNQSWWDLGNNIGQGIYNGLLYNSGTLSGLAWNTAVDMYNSAARALGIASPSKKFRWIAEMMTAGLSKGIEDTKDDAIKSVARLAQDVVSEAEDAEPTFDFGFEIDNALTNFSDTVAVQFENLIARLESIADRVTLNLPNVVQGKVVPYSVATSDRYPQTNTQITELSNKLDDILDSRITRDDIIDIVQRYLSWSIGDEQLARHVNAGNNRLNRRLSPINGGV